MRLGPPLTARIRTGLELHLPGFAKRRGRDRKDLTLRLWSRCEPTGGQKLSLKTVNRPSLLHFSDRCPAPRGRPADLPKLENAARPSGSLDRRHTPQFGGHAPRRRPAPGRSRGPGTRQWPPRLRARERGAGRSGPPEGAGQEGAVLLRPRAGEYGRGLRAASGLGPGSCLRPPGAQLCVWGAPWRIRGRERERRL